MDTDRYDSRKVVENQYFFLIWLSEIPSDFESAPFSHLGTSPYW